MTQAVKVDLTKEINPNFYKVWNSKKPNKVLKGGRNSFKSSVIAIRLVYEMLMVIKDGFMLEGGFHDIDGQRYYFGKDGDCKYRWQEIDGHWYYFYHDDGHMVKDSLLIGRGGQVYFLDKEGRMLANCTAEFNKSGELCINGKPVDGSFIYDDGLADN